MDLRRVHMIVEKHMLRYLKGMVEYGLRYMRYQRIFLWEYVDLDWDGSATYRKNTSGCCFSLGYGMISWFSKKQMSVALSTVKVDYIATCSTRC